MLLRFASALARVVAWIGVHRVVRVPLGSSK